jgi:hypothetical protein
MYEQTYLCDGNCYICEIEDSTLYGFMVKLPAAPYEGSILFFKITGF